MLGTVNVSDREDIETTKNWARSTKLYKPLGLGLGLRWPSFHRPAWPLYVSERTAETTSSFICISFPLFTQKSHQIDMAGSVGAFMTIALGVGRRCLRPCLYHTSPSFVVRFGRKLLSSPNHAVRSRCCCDGHFLSSISPLSSPKRVVLSPTASILLTLFKS